MVTLAFGVAFPEIIARFDDLTGGAEGLTIAPDPSVRRTGPGFTLGEKDPWLYWLTIVVLGS